jgi:hypothetical protein
MKPVDADYFALLFGIQVNMQTAESCPCISSSENFKDKFIVKVISEKFN